MFPLNSDDERPEGRYTPRQRAAPLPQIVAGQEGANADPRLRRRAPGTRYRVESATPRCRSSGAVGRQCSPSPGSPRTPTATTA